MYVVFTYENRRMKPVDLRKGEGEKRENDGEGKSN
jgi:hypothetical protein